VTAGANPRDGYLDRLLYRRCSRPLTERLLRTSIHPNAVTLVGIAAGVTGGLLVGSPGTAALLGGAALLFVSAVFDCSDGELARRRGAETRLGHVLDVTGDMLVNLALLVGIAARVMRSGWAPAPGVLALLLAGVVASFAAITWSEQTEDRRHRLAGAWENRVLDGVLAPLTTRDWYVFPLAFALAGRLELLVPAAALGAQVFWATVALLVRRVLRRAQAQASVARVAQ
jgi:phosphatidylglycerophosphate synthase